MSIETLANAARAAGFAMAASEDLLSSGTPETVDRRRDEPNHQQPVRRPRDYWNGRGLASGQQASFAGRWTFWRAA